MHANILDKPRQSFWGLWNISFGYFGIQIAFGLQNANVSRIFQSLGSSIDNLAFLWIAGPVTGLVVQPLIGHFSDRTWTRFGRRRPYFLAGALLAAVALLALPVSGVLVAAALFLWLLDASLNVAMEPFRAFVGDMTPASQRAQGFAFQTAFIGAGAVAGSLAPALLATLGVSNTAPAGLVPPSVVLSFAIGAVAILLSVGWTVWRVREFPPEELIRFNGGERVHDDPLVYPSYGPRWIAGGMLLLATVAGFSLDKQLYVLGAGLVVFGSIQIGVRVRRSTGALAHIVSDLAQMPPAMRQLALAQFFTWIAMFVMWIYTTPVVTRAVFHAADTASSDYNAGADWVGIMFAFYNGVAALAAFGLPLLARRIGNVRTHATCLVAGAAGFLLLMMTTQKLALLVPMVGVGIAWASILGMPYVILTSVVPQRKLGVYIGIFNFFIVLPQLLVATVMGGVMRSFFPDDPRRTLAIAALAMTVAAISMLRVVEKRGSQFD